MTSNRFYDTIQDMRELYLQNRFVTLLYNYEIESKYFTTASFIDHIVNKKWWRFKRLGESEEHYLDRMKKAFNGIVPPSDASRADLKDYYIGFFDNNYGKNLLSVTNEGMYFKGYFGLIQALYVRYKGPWIPIAWILTTLGSFLLGQHVDWHNIWELIQFGLL